MDILTFISKIADSFAWPIVTLIGILLLRKPILGFLPFVQKLKYKEFEVEFGKRVEEVTAEVERELPTTDTQPGFAQLESNPIFKLAEVSPRSAVLEAWRSVEIASLNAAKKIFGPKYQNRSMTYRALREFEKNEKIDRNILGLIRDLRGLRNEAAHAPEFALNMKSALDYANAAQSVVKYLNSVAAG